MAQLDIRNIAKVFGAPQMFGGVVEVAGAVHIRDNRQQAK
jgi:hypothetical protein